MVHLIRTVDAHVGGQPLRLIVEGLPRPIGTTMAQKRDWVKRHADQLRRALVLEPRGHTDMSATVLTEPVSPGSHAGLLFMDSHGYPAMSGHGVIAAATIAIERDLLFTRDASDAEIPVVFDTVAGAVHARARLDQRGQSRRVDSVAFTSVPSFVHTAAHPVRLGSRMLRVDIAFGGRFYAMVDTEATGIPLEPSRLADLRRLGIDIQRAVNGSYAVAHPAERSLAGLSGVIFTGPARDPEAHLRNVTVTAGGAADRCPSGTGTAAVMAVLDAMGLLPENQLFVHESITGALFRGRAAQRTIVGDRTALVAEIEGSAWITGEHTFLIDDDDPFREGLSF